jgi:hypothetical protein
MQEATLRLEARWDEESRLWVATCIDLPDLDIRAATMAELIATTTSLFSSVLQRINSQSVGYHSEVRHCSECLPTLLVH